MGISSVWIVTKSPHHANPIAGTFSTREAADRYVVRAATNHLDTSFDTREWPLGDPLSRRDAAAQRAEGASADAPKFRDVWIVFSDLGIDDDASYSIRGVFATSSGADACVHSLAARNPHDVFEYGAYSVDDPMSEF